LNDNLVSILLFVVYNMTSSSPYFTPADALAASTHTITTHDTYNHFYNKLFDFITAIHDNPGEQFKHAIANIAPTPTFMNNDGIVTHFQLPSGVYLICNNLSTKAHELFNGIPENFPNMLIDQPELSKEMYQLFYQPEIFWKDLSKSVDVKLRKFVKFAHIEADGIRFQKKDIHGNPTGKICGILKKFKNDQDYIDDYLSKDYVRITDGYVINPLTPFQFDPTTTRRYVESVAQGHFSTPDQCNNVIGEQVSTQTCSICGRLRLPDEKFSCEHTLEVLLLIICCTLAPSAGDDAIKDQIYEFLRAINAYTWCCKRCNYLKANVQSRIGIFIHVVQDTTGAAGFTRNIPAIDEYIVQLPSWNHHWFQGTQTYYVNDPVSLQTESRQRIHNIIDPLINALNSLYIQLWGSFQNMMLFGIIKIIAMMGKINCYPLPKLPKTRKNATGGSKLTNITNTKIKYNMKGGVTPMEESVRLLSKLYRHIPDMINYYALYCTLLPDFSNIVNIVIKLQRWLRRSRERITTRDRDIINFDPDTITSETDTDAIFQKIESINHIRLEKLKYYVKMIIDNNGDLDDNQKYQIIKFIKNYDEDEQNVIIQNMIDLNIPIGYLSNLFSQELQLEQILEDVRQEPPAGFILTTPKIPPGGFNFELQQHQLQQHQLQQHLQHRHYGGTIKRKSKRRKSKRRRNNKKRSRK
jgi:hypothetical protein